MYPSYSYPSLWKNSIRFHDLSFYFNMARPVFKLYIFLLLIDYADTDQLVSESDSNFDR